jgi:hypothetical protein
VGAEFPFRVIAERAEKAGVILTTNLTILLRKGSRIPSIQP